MTLERRTEIVEAKVAELVELGASVERRTRHDDPEGNEFCVSEQRPHGADRPL